MGKDDNRRTLKTRRRRRQRKLKARARRKMDPKRLEAALQRAAKRKSS